MLLSILLAQNKTQTSERHNYQITYKARRKTMKNPFWQAGILLFTVLLAACSSTPKYQQAMDLSVNDYQQSISRDDIEDLIILSSKKALHNNPGTTDSEYDDNYARAVINKLTNEISYQIVNTIQYQAPNWRFYHQAKYVTQEGVSDERIIVIDQQVLECSVFSDCSYQETISFEITEEIVKKGAERYQPDMQVGIKYMLIPEVGENYKGIIFAQELIALYNAARKFQE